MCLIVDIPKRFSLKFFFTIRVFLIKSLLKKKKMVFRYRERPVLRTDRPVLSDSEFKTLGRGSVFWCSLISLRFSLVENWYPSILLPWLLDILWFHLQLHFVRYEFLEFFMNFRYWGLGLCVLEEISNFCDVLGWIDAHRW